MHQIYDTDILIFLSKRVIILSILFFHSFKSIWRLFLNINRKSQH